MSNVLLWNTLWLAMHVHAMLGMHAHAMLGIESTSTIRELSPQKAQCCHMTSVEANGLINC